MVGGDYGECGARAYNGGLGAEPPAGYRGRAPLLRSSTPCSAAYGDGDQIHGNSVGMGSTAVVPQVDGHLPPDNNLPPDKILPGHLPPGTNDPLDIRP